MKDMCAECGADLRKDDVVTAASVPMVHAIPELKVSEEVSYYFKAFGCKSCLIFQKSILRTIILTKTLFVILGYRLCFVWLHGSKMKFLLCSNSKDENYFLTSC